MVDLDVQIAVPDAGLPDAACVQRWVDAAVAGSARTAAALTVRFVGAEEGLALNRQFRGRTAPTNVLSFPAELPEAVGLDLLGDVVLCAPVVEREAREQGKRRHEHYAHLVIHGTLHLLGLDHADAASAEHMERVERTIMARLGLHDPYAGQR